MISIVLITISTYKINEEKFDMKWAIFQVILIVKNK